MARPINPERKQQRRQQILHAAGQCFVQHGFHRTSVQQICDAAQMSPGGLYRHFKSKDDIIVAIAEEERRSTLELAAWLNTAPKPLQALVDMPEPVLAAYQQPEQVALAIEVLAEAARNDVVASVLNDSQQQLQQAITHALERAREQGELDTQAINDAHIAKTIMALLEGFITHASGSDRSAPRAFADTAKRLIKALLGADNRN
ncbi:hypothetical protein CHH28_05105 [Bacterioplanes sanyensis]|uniref:HTH tetR-type domain-containing protein n=1 Tax=Bacterioplanes sanyensis TaxID=1249553 RepID=A0A222FG99_9GAMM|nr:TetR/AcrR family transcriptional regulator [Bacterioplanes sanyensis]ASP38097.1 hypothetical protein CHH28_05105 [Bacterioplanes sanyensis]